MNHSLSYSTMMSGMALKNPYWYSPSPLEIPYPPLNWVQVSTRKKILDKLDLEIKTTNNRMDKFKGDPDREQEYYSATEAWKKALYEKFILVQGLEDSLV